MGKVNFQIINITLIILLTNVKKGPGNKIKPNPGRIMDFIPLKGVGCSCNT